MRNLLGGMRMVGGVASSTSKKIERICWHDYRIMGRSGASCLAVSVCRGRESLPATPKGQQDVSLGQGCSSWLDPFYWGSRAVRSTRNHAACRDWYPSLVN